MKITGNDVIEQLSIRIGQPPARTKEEAYRWDVMCYIKNSKEIDMIESDIGMQVNKWSYAPSFVVANQQMNDYLETLVRTLQAYDNRQKILKSQV